MTGKKLFLPKLKGERAEIYSSRQQFWKEKWSEEKKGENRVGESKRRGKFLVKVVTVWE